jgi:DNA-binding response OmpR family regulator
VTKKVLDVGQCNLDHGNISNLLKREFDAEVQRAHSFDEATKMASDTPYDLILINRILDADGTAGMAVLHELKNQPATNAFPVMIVSNFQDAQDEAVKSGAESGFGKSELDSDSTRERLAQFLG